MQIGSIEMASPKTRQRPLVEEARKKKLKTVPKPSGRPETEIGEVANPSVHGFPERVERIVDTLWMMLKRKHITKREYEAGDRYRTSVATMFASLGSVMDFDRVSGGSIGTLPAEAAYIARQDLEKVEHALYPEDLYIVHLICALDYSIKQATFTVYDGCSRAQMEECSRCFRKGLKRAAQIWWPSNEGKGARIVSFVSERATVSDVESVPQSSSVAHATRDKVFRK